MKGKIAFGNGSLVRYAVLSERGDCSTFDLMSDG